MVNIVIAEHAVAYPSKTLCQTGGRHIVSIKVTDDIDNGCIVRKGQFIDLDAYEEATASTMTGVIQKQAANGNWYIEITANPDEELFLYNQPFIAEDYTNRFKAEKNFYNAAGEYVRGYDLAVGDVVEVSASGISGTPSVGATVTVSNKKFTV